MPDKEVKRAASYRRTTLYEILLLRNQINSGTPESVAVMLLDPTLPPKISPLPPVKWKEFVPRPFKLKPPKGLDLGQSTTVVYEDAQNS